MLLLTVIVSKEELDLTQNEALFLFVIIFLNYHLEHTYKESYCEKFVSQRNLNEFRAMLNNLKDGIFIA